MKPIAEALGVSRSHLISSFQQENNNSSRKVREQNNIISDEEIILKLRIITNGRPTYGYRRACAVLNRNLIKEGVKRVNHKRVYRIMKMEKLLLPKYIGFKPERKHEGKVITLRSNTRWCSDALQIRCWDGQKIEMAFVMDTCDRAILSYVAIIGHLNAKDIQNMLVLSLEKRFPKRIQLPHTIEWLTDNGKIFTADETKKLAKNIGLLSCQTPAYSPESNGMSESFVKRFKQDYVQVNELWVSDEVLLKIPEWLNDYNENHPHKGLGMMSPNEFIKQNIS
jgi:transposase InsO family protein